MEYSIEFGADPLHVTVVCSGSADIDEIRRLNDQLVSDARFRTGMTMLVDTSELDTRAFSDQDLRALTDRVLERDWEYPPRAIAVVRPTPLDSAVDSQWSAYVEVVDLLGTPRRMFGSRDEALTWLREQRSPQPGV